MKTNEWFSRSDLLPSQSADYVLSVEHGRVHLAIINMDAYPDDRHGRPKLVVSLDPEEANSLAQSLQRCASEAS